MAKGIFITVTGDFTNTEKLILRDYLALERTKLANERTLFSYIRTALYLLPADIGIIGESKIGKFISNKLQENI